MATSKSKSSSKTTTVQKSNNRPKPMINKAGVTRSGRRSYSNGGKAY